MPFLFLSASLAAWGCASACADIEPERWVRVARDANYDVYIDSSRVRATMEGSRAAALLGYEVWYRTDHRVPRLQHGAKFNREVVHSIVQCDSMWFKVVSVDMSMGDAKPVIQQLTPRDDLTEEPWRRVTRGTTEEIAAEAACFYGTKRRRARPG